jgi:hypothetical protein
MPKAQKRAVAIAAHHVRLIGYGAEVRYRTFVLFSALAERLNDCVITQHLYPQENKHTHLPLTVCDA